MLTPCRSRRRPIWSDCGASASPSRAVDRHSRRDWRPSHKHLVPHGVLQDQVNEHLTRRDALVAALAVTALGGQALARPRPSRAAAMCNIGVILPLSHSPDSDAAANIL